MPQALGTITLADVILQAVATGTRDVAVSLPGIVVSYNPATETATIQPAIDRLLPADDEPDEDVAEKLPAIPDVPVAWYRARGVSIVPPVGLLPGDPVTLLCMDRDISAWLRSGARSEPDDARCHSWQNAIAIPGLVPSANPFTAPTDAAALASKLDAIGRPLALIAAATNPAETMAAVNSILLAFKNSYPTALNTCASQILKVDL